MADPARMRAYITKMHRGRGRQDGTPDSVHLKRVATILLTALKATGEMPSGKARDTLECAALGHDLLEDTKSQPAEVEKIAGKEALGYIEALTNRWGDAHPKPYVTQVSSSPEEARLVKLADLYDNTTQASVSIKTLGSPWMKNYFLPIIDPMRTAITKTKFKRYPKTSALLIQMTTLARAHLGQSIELFLAKGTWRD